MKPFLLEKFTDDQMTLRDFRRSHDLFLIQKEPFMVFPLLKDLSNGSRYFFCTRLNIWSNLALRKGRQIPK